MKKEEGIFKWKEFVVICSIENKKWHMSISHESRDLSYQEIKEARYEFCPENIYMAQIFPPQSEFVNVHPYCFHLWQL